MSAAPRKEVTTREVVAVRFGMLTDDEVRRLSVKRITSPVTYDTLMNAVPDGLYDAAPGAEGKLYEVDMRLRPSGRQGPVATSIQSFCSYQEDEAWTWEHLALTRARPLAGTPVWVAADAPLRLQSMQSQKAIARLQALNPIFPWEIFSAW